MIITDQRVLTQTSAIIMPGQQTISIFQLLEDNFNKEKMIGLSAIQIGIPLRAFIVYYDNNMYYFANPKVIGKGKKEKLIEGCLSIPDLIFHVPRYYTIDVEDDISGYKTYEYKLAQAIQHEFDHLNGKTLIQTGKLV